MPHDHMIQISIRLLCFFWCLLSLSGQAHTPTNEFSIPSYRWEEIHYSTKNKNLGNPGIRGSTAREFTQGRPVYISLTTIDSRIHQVDKTVSQIFKGLVIPDHVYLFLSAESYILDKGISRESLPERLLELTVLYPFSVVYTRNIGPHRKLLPLLARKWKEDCIIITMDDEFKLGIEGFLFQLLKYHVAGNQSNVVALQTRRIGFCDDESPPRVHRYRHWNEISYGVRELLTLQSGTSSVLYRPSFFHPIVFNEDFRELTSKADDLTFRLSTLVNRVPIVAGCKNRYVKPNDASAVVCRNHCPDRTEVLSKIPDDRKTPLFLLPTEVTAKSSPTNAVEMALSLGASAVTDLRERGYPFLFERNFSHLLGSWEMNTALSADSSLECRRKQPGSASPASPGSRKMQESSLQVEQTQQTTDKSSSKRGRSLKTAEFRESKSLFGTFNRFEGNDNQWAAGAKFLFERGLLDLGALADQYLYAERGPGCGRNESNRPSSCMIYTSCRQFAAVV